MELKEDMAQYTISMPLIDDIELKKIDTFYNDIIDEYLKSYVKEKEQIIIQQLMKNLREENIKYKSALNEIRKILKQYERLAPSFLNQFRIDISKSLEILDKI